MGLADGNADGALGSVEGIPEGDADDALLGTEKRHERWSRALLGRWQLLDVISSSSQSLLCAWQKMIVSVECRWYNDK